MPLHTSNRLFKISMRLRRINCTIFIYRFCELSKFEYVRFLYCCGIIFASFVVVQFQFDHHDFWHHVSVGWVLLAFVYSIWCCYATVSIFFMVLFVRTVFCNHHINKTVDLSVIVADQFRFQFRFQFQFQFQFYYYQFHLYLYLFLFYFIFSIHLFGCLLVFIWNSILFVYS